MSSRPLAHHAAGADGAHAAKVARVVCQLRARAASARSPTTTTISTRRPAGPPAGWTTRRAPAGRLRRPNHDPPARRVRVQWRLVAHGHELLRVPGPRPGPL